MAKIIRAISIRQPYVEQILRGDKTREYRSQDTQIRERVYLYAALSAGPDNEWKEIEVRPGDLPTGRIVGTVEIVGTTQLRDGSFAYDLARPKRLKTYLVAANQPQPRFWRPEFKQVRRRRG